jgi:SAM-dependent methyltransferase
METVVRRPFLIMTLVILATAAGALFRFSERIGAWDLWGLLRYNPEDPVWLAPYETTPQEVVDRMLEMAEMQPDDVVYDLGSGDGRIVITAARRYGARGVGFELDEKLVRQAQENARRTGVTGRARFHHQDVMTVDLSPATVVTLYLLQDANLKLRSRLLSQLRHGARVISHKFHMGDWEPDRMERVRAESGEFHTLYLWRIASRRPTG